MTPALPSRTLTRLAPLALVIGLVFGAPQAWAQGGVGSRAAALSTLAAQPKRLSAKLKASHADVNRALKVRAQRMKSFKSALARRERAAGRVENLKAQNKTGLVLDRALREALAHDEEAQRARAKLLEAEREVARRGARLLEVYDAVLAERGRQVTSLTASDSRRAKALATYQALSKQRSKVRAALQPVLEERVGQAASLVQVQARPTDDVETLLEKSDLARDLEDRFMRRAEAVARRIRELESEQSLARETIDMVSRGQLFDERDYRPVFTGGRTGLGVRVPNLTGPMLPLAASAAADSAGGAAPQNAAVQAPPPSNERASDVGGDGDQDDGDALGGEVNTPSPPPPSDPDQGAPGTDDPAPEPGGGGNFNNGADDVNTQTDSDGAFEGEPGTVTSAPEAARGAAAPSALPAEQVFLGTGAAADAQLRSLIASDDLSLNQLKALEKRLRQEARTMSQENRRIKKQIKGDLARRQKRK